MKKFMSIVLVLILLMANVAVSFAEDTDNIRNHSWQLGHILTGADNDNYHVFCTYFANNVKEMSGGKMQVEVLPNAQLGGERDMVEGMQLGTIDFAMLTNVNVSVFSPILYTNDLPFIYPDLKTAREVLDGELGREMLVSLEKLGIKGLAWGEGGFRQIITSKKEIRTPADLQGQKMRSLENQLYISTYSALGTNPTPMAWTETFTGLQQGTIDGLDIPIGVIYSNGFYQIAPYISRVNLYYSPLFIAVSLNIWDSLNAQEQEVLMNAAIKAGQDERAFNEEMDDEFVEDMISKGVTVIDDIDREGFQNAVTSVHDAYADQIGKEFLDKVKEKVEELQNQ